VSGCAAGWEAKDRRAPNSKLWVRPNRPVVAQLLVERPHVILLKLMCAMVMPKRK
jgi:hypothetical protein